MKKKLILILCLIISSAFVLSACGNGDRKLPKKHKFVYDESQWNVAFMDEFNGTDLNTKNWKVNTMNHDNGIRRAAYYSDDSDTVFVKDGNLVIRTAFKNGEHGNGWYTGWVETSVNQHGEYEADDFSGFNTNGGYFEVKCKAPPTKGIWSAFWLMPDEGTAFTPDDVQYTGKDGVEVDIMESFGYTYGKSTVTHVLHSDGYDKRLKTSKSPTYKVDDMYDTYHTYAMEWTKDKYIFYVDGFKTWETSYEYDGHIMGVADVLSYMILSVEVAGVNENGVLYAGMDKKDGKFESHWAGNPDDNNKTKTYDFVIDYVKVLTRK